MMHQELKSKENDMATLSLKDRFTIPTYDDPDQMKMADLIFDTEKCKECGICILLCPGGCILSDTVTKMDFIKETSTKGNCGPPTLDSRRPGVTLCIACFDCGTACPTGAISIKNHFNPGYYYKRLTQTSDMRYPKRY